MRGRSNAVHLWIVWFAIFSGLFVIQFILGGGIPTGENSGVLPMGTIAIGASLFLFSLVVRWFVIPRVAARGLEALMAVMIVGIAVAEGLVFVGIFLVPETLPQLRLACFLASVIGVGQFVPVYAGR